MRPIADNFSSILKNKKFKPSIIVHGGAWKIPKGQWKKHIKGCGYAAQTGYQIMMDGGTAVMAVVEAVKVMEDDPTFDAGVGALLNLLGEVELDAIVVDGAGTRSGAVAVVKNIKNPILLALKVMELTPHRLLAGRGAELFAKKIGIGKCRTRDLVVGRELRRYELLRKIRDFEIADAFRVNRGGTVGAAAIDENGDLAAATSTGGVPMKLPGRVGDTPILGSGAFADNRSGAASATGWGESIMKAGLTKAACDYIGKGVLAGRAARMAINELGRVWKGLGGVIVVDKFGNLGMAYNTPQMAYAKIGRNGNLSAGVD